MNTHEDLSRVDISFIRKPIKILLKGGKDPDEAPGADQATASGMIQQVVAILDGLEKPELDATGWAKNVESYTERKPLIILPKGYVTT
jgi:hypothetical protein